MITGTYITYRFALVLGLWKTTIKDIITNDIDGYRTVQTNHFLMLPFLVVRISVIEEYELPPKSN